MAEISTLIRPEGDTAGAMRTPDDLTRLLEVFRVPGWPYTDFSAGGAYEGALERWSLLDELAGRAGGRSA